MTSLDSNVLIALHTEDAVARSFSRIALDRARAAGSVHVCGAVFSELLGFPGRDRVGVDTLLAELRIEVDWNMREADWVKQATPTKAMFPEGAQAGVGCHDEW